MFLHDYFLACDISTVRSQTLTREGFTTESLNTITDNISILVVNIEWLLLMDIIY